MKISYVIPAKNAGKTIEQSVQSIINTELTDDYEILIIENDSTDNTVYKVHQLMKEFPCVQLIQCPNSSGVSHARNAGVLRSQGEYICFIDADDFLDEKAGAYFCEDLKAFPEADLYAYGHFHGKDPISLEAYYGENECIRVQMLQNPTKYMQIWGKLFKRKLIIKHQIWFNEQMSLSEDSDFMLRYTKYCKMIHVSSQNSYHYCTEADSVMRSFDKKKAYKYAEALACTEKQLSGESKEMQAAFREYAIIHFNIAMVRGTFSKNNPLSVRKKRKELITISEKKVFKQAIDQISKDDLKNKVLIPAYLVKKKCYFLAALAFRMRAAQNYKKEK